MGFEQLASLKEQLAQQAQAKQAAKQVAKQASPPDVAAKKPVDPVVQTIGQLQKHFPLAFPKNPNPKLPLKIGIHHDVLAHAEQLGFNEADLLKAIKTWCWGNRYWTCIVENAARVDLQGNPVGLVTKENAIQAKRFKHRAKQQRNKAANAAADNSPAAVTVQPEPAPAPAPESDA